MLINSFIKSEHNDLLLCFIEYHNSIKILLGMNNVLV